MTTIKVSRHNGRSGKNGTYNPKHNDRNFDLNNSEHINEKMAMQNIYWDCMDGKRHATSNRKFRSFDEIEYQFYQENYSQFVRNQNERNAIIRHTERNRTVEDIYKNKKTCPEESIYQLGNMESSVSSEDLIEVAEEFFEWFDDEFGEHIHILDWALHVDEATPHIHERHVFDAPNKYGEIAPQQDKALEMLGIELPYPNRPKSKNNNRKMTFDAMCRKRFLEICEENGLSVEKEAEYGGRKYLEKNDFIIQNQKHKIQDLNINIREKKKELRDTEVEMAAIDTVMNSIAVSAYDTACNAIVDNVVHDINEYEQKEIMDTARGEKAFGYSSFELKAIGHFVQKLIHKLEDEVSGLIKMAKWSLNEHSNRSKNIQSINDQMWRNLDRIARTGPNDNEIRFGEHLDIDSMNEIGTQASEVARQVIRRRGR